jgi:hypothetical protein
MGLEGVQDPKVLKGWGIKSLKIGNEKRVPVHGGGIGSRQESSGAGFVKNFV